MTGSLRRPRRKPGENRELLLEAGLIEFGLFGYHGASTAAIARRADVPQPHVYTSFRTKQELFFACLERASMDVRTRAGVDVSVTMQRMVLQAIASAHDPALSGRLIADLDDLRSELGAGVFGDLARTAAHSLIDPASPRAGV